MTIASSSCSARLVALALAVVSPSLLAQPALAAPSLAGRAVWAQPRDAGTTEESVRAFVDQLARAHINTVVMEVKSSRGLFWPSTGFPEAVVPEYRDFDFPAVLVREAHARNIQVHAWFFDYAEGADSYVVRQHPEWLMLGPDGKPTTAEILRGRPYNLAWMCPARRPGYTDQWLVPVITEFAARYDVDAVHLMPMDYRSHYAGDFDAHLDLLAESIRQQKTWARDFRHLWIGLAAYQFYQDERRPLTQLRDLVKAGGAPPEMRAAFDQVASRLQTFAPDLHADLAAHLRAPGETAALATKLEAFLANPPAGYFAPDTFLKTLERARAEQVDGIVIFSAGGLTAHGLWDTVRDFFSR